MTIHLSQISRDAVITERTVGAKNFDDINYNYYSKLYLFLR